MFGNYQWVEAVDASDDQQERQGHPSHCKSCSSACTLCVAYAAFTFALPDLTAKFPVPNLATCPFVHRSGASERERHAKYWDRNARIVPFNSKSAVASSV